jgi:hypothetical protein
MTSDNLILLLQLASYGGVLPSGMSAVAATATVACLPRVTPLLHL